MHLNQRLRRATRLGSVAVVLVSLGALFVPTQSAAAPCGRGAIQFLPNPSCVAQDAQRTWNTAKGAAQGAGDIAQGHPVRALADIAVPAVTGDDTGGRALQNQGQQMANATMQRLANAVAGFATPNLQADWFRPEFSVFALLAGALALPLLCIAVIDAALHQNWRMVGRSVGIYLPLAAIGGVAFTAFGNAILQVIDGVSSLILQSVQSKVPDVLSGVAFGVAALSGPFGWGGAFIAGLIVFLFGLLIWFELALRAGALYLITLFVPLCLAAMIWPRRVQIGGRILRAAFSVAASKLVIFAALALATSLFATLPKQGMPGYDPLTNALTGIGLVILAALSPVALYKLIPLAAEGASAGIGSVRSAAAETAMGGSFAVNSGQVALHAMRSRANAAQPPSEDSGGGSGTNNPGNGQGPRPIPRLPGGGAGSGELDTPNQGPKSPPGQLPRSTGGTGSQDTTGEDFQGSS
jgi:hypothetical protein